MLDELREAVIKLCNDCSSIISVGKVSNPKISDHSNLKILSLNQMLQRSPVALAQVNACNTSKNLLNEIRQIIYSLYQVKKILKKYATK